MNLLLLCMRMHLLLLLLVRDGSGARADAAASRPVLPFLSFFLSFCRLILSACMSVDVMRLVQAEKLVVPSAGVHIVLPDHFCPSGMGLIVPKTKDGRVLFFLPWEGNTLCGTTDSKSDLTMLPEPSAKEINFILEESRRFLNKVAAPRIRHAFFVS